MRAYRDPSQGHLAHILFFYHHAKATRAEQLKTRTITGSAKLG